MIDKTAGTAAGVADMMAQIRAYQAKVQGAPTQASPQASPLQALPPQTAPIQKPSFAEVVSSSLTKVNDLQSQSTRMREAYEKGEKVPLTDVVLSMQKSSLAFEATLQIRNKIMRAYEDVLNMPV